MQPQPAQPQETWLAPLPADVAGLPAQQPTDHSLAGLFPLLEGDDFASLQADIAANGLHEPIVLLDGRILDGRNRHRACLAAGVAPRFTTYDGDDPIGYVLSLNLHRRHLDESQRAMVASKLANLTAGRPHAVDNRANLPGIPAPAPAISAAKAAEMLNVSERSVKAARSVQAQAIPEIIAKVERGEFKVSAAAEVAKLPTSVQRVIAMCSKLPTAAEARKMAKEKGVYVPARDGKLHDGRSAAEEKADGDASQRAGSILHPLKEIIETGMTPASYFAALDVPRFGRFLDDELDAVWAEAWPWFEQFNTLWRAHRAA